MEPPSSYTGSLESPTRILGLHRGLEDTKRTRSKLHDVVHAFRGAHGAGNLENYDYPPEYLAALRKYSRIPVGSPHAEAINELSRPEVYASIVQAGRMRRSMRVPEGGELAGLCREIRAALVWRCNFPD